MDDRDERFTMEDLQAARRLPFTRAAAARAFIKGRGCFVPASRKAAQAATECVHLDATTE
jgi:hypothetical protein